MTDSHIDSPNPHRGPYAELRDDDLRTAYDRAVADPDSVTALILLAEMQHRGIAE